MTNQPQRPLSILHLTFASDAGGLSRYIFDLGSAMHAQGHKIAVAGDRGAWHWLFESAPFPWIDLPFRGGPWGMRQSLQILNQYLDQHPVDVLHTHYRRCTLVARRIRRHPQIPILYTLHLSNISIRWWRRPFTDFGDCTHVASEEARKWLIDSAHLPPERISLIPHGIDPRQYPLADNHTKTLAKAQLGLAPDDLVVVYVGRWDYPKNEDWMLDLAAASRDRLPKLKTLLVGQGPHQPMLEKRIQREHLQDRVMLLGHRQPLPIYQAADALLLPSLREGFSLVCAEAMSTGIPIFRTATAGTSALVIENVTGRSTPIDRQAFIREAIEFLSNPADLKRMGQAAARHVREHFTFDRQVHDTVGLYRSLPACTALY